MITDQFTMQNLLECCYLVQHIRANHNYIQYMINLEAREKYEMICISYVIN